MKNAGYAIIALLFALAATGAMAAGLRDAQHIIVVQGGQHAADVVTGANFAASMKSAQGVAYTSAIDTDAYAELADADLAGKTIVVISGKNVRILGNDPTAQSYFAQQGFSVRTINDPTRDDLLVDAQSNPSAASPQQTTPAGDGEGAVDANGRTPQDDGVRESTPLRPREPETTFVVNDTQGSASARNATPPEQTPTPTPRTDEPGLATRVWRWFAGLF